MSALNEAISHDLTLLVFECRYGGTYAALASVEDCTWIEMVMNGDDPEWNQLVNYLSENWVIPVKYGTDADEALSNLKKHLKIFGENYGPTAAGVAGVIAELKELHKKSPWSFISDATENGTLPDLSEWLPDLI